MNDRYCGSDGAKGEPVRPKESQEEKWRRIRKRWGIERDEEDDARIEPSRASSSKDGIAADENEQPEEGGRPKYRKMDNTPSQRKVDEHMMTHIPFRSWCPHCIR